MRPCRKPTGVAHVLRKSSSYRGEFLWRQRKGAGRRPRGRQANAAAQRRSRRVAGQLRRNRLAEKPLRESPRKRNLQRGRNRQLVKNLQRENLLKRNPLRESRQRRSRLRENHLRRRSLAGKLQLNEARRCEDNLRSPRLLRLWFFRRLTRRCLTPWKSFLLTPLLHRLERWTRNESPPFSGGDFFLHEGGSVSSPPHL